MRQPRWMFAGVLLLVVFGLFWMHSVGHSPSGHDGPSMAAGHTAMPAVADGHDAMTVTAVLTPDQPVMTMDPIALCVAILTALVLAVGLSALRLRSRLAMPSRSRALGGPGSGRGPPGPAFGLLVADLSVLRH